MLAPFFQYPKLDFHRHHFNEWSTPQNMNSNRMYAPERFVKIVQLASRVSTAVTAANLPVRAGS
jgi:hypothetical protein